jgi:hypothetical protein
MTTPTPAQRLAAEGIADSAQDLRQLSAAELLGLFAFASSGKINAPAAGNLQPSVVRCGGLRMGRRRWNSHSKP